MSPHACGPLGIDVVARVPATSPGWAHNYEHVPRNMFVDEGPCHANKAVMKGLDMPAQKTLEGLIEREQRRDRPRIGQHHHETGKRPGAVADADGPKRAPVHLRLFGC